MKKVGAELEPQIAGIEVLVCYAGRRDHCMRLARQNKETLKSSSSQANEMSANILVKYCKGELTQFPPILAMADL